MGRRDGNIASAAGSSPSRAAVSPSNNSGEDGTNETKQREAIEMTGMISRGSRQRPQSIDLDEDAMTEGRVWSFSQTGMVREPQRDFQQVNPLHSPQQQIDGDA